MKRIIAALIIFVLYIAPSYSQEHLDFINSNKKFEEIQQSAKSYFDNRGTGPGTGYKLYKRWEYFAKRNLNADGFVIRSSDALERATNFQNASENFMFVPASDWVEMGPMSAINTSTWSSHLGRISAVAIDSANRNHIIVGAPTGGIWKTIDEGLSWTPIFDDQASINVWSLLIDPNDADVYIAGTQGLGIMKSIDGGLTWTNKVGPNTFDLIKRLDFDPNNWNNLFALNQNGTLWRSTNRGENWTLTKSFGVSVYDIDFKPGSSDTLYVSGGGKVFRSIDNGLTFNEISGPWSSNSGDAIKIAVSPAAPK